MTACWPADWNLGDDAYLGYVDVFHQIHCLDNLRRAAHYEHYFRDLYGDEGPTNLYWWHVSHCVDTLLQNIMCNADVSVVTYNWVGDQENGYPDFRMNKKCRDFDKVVEWAKEHYVDSEHPRHLSRPKGNLKYSAR